MFKNKKVLIAYILVCILWGSTYIGIRIGMKTIEPEVFGAFRFISVGVILLFIVKIKKLNSKISLVEFVKISIGGILLLFFAGYFLMFGEKNVDSGTASIIMATIPLFIALLEFIFTKENRLNFRAYIGLVIGFAGVFYLIYNTSTSLEFNIISLLILLMSSILWSAGTLYTKKIEAQCSFLLVVAIQNLVGGIFFLIFSIVKGTLFTATFSNTSVLALLYLIIFGSIVGYSAYTYIMKEMPAAKAGTYAYINPIVAIMLGVLILNEKINLQMVISMFVIFIGVFLVQSSHYKSRLNIK